ncbi:MAG: PAS domain-containing protein [bacterium]
MNINKRILNVLLPLMGAVFFVEVGVMFLLHTIFGWEMHASEFAIDGLLLVFILMPILHWLVVRPFLIQAKAIESARKELADSGNFLQNIVQGITDGVLLLSNHKRVMWANDALLKRKKCQMSDLTGKLLKDTVQSEEIDLLERAIDEVIVSKKLQKIVLEEKDCDNNLRMIEMVLYPIVDDDGSVSQIISLSRDLTDKEQAEQEQRLNSEIFKNMAEGVYLIGLDDGIIKYANRRFEEMFGYEPGEMIGKEVSIVNAPTDKSPVETKNAIVEYIRKHGEWHGEVNNIKKDGTPFWCYANVSIFEHPQFGRVILAVHTDITDQRQAEEEILSLSRFPSENPFPVLRINHNKEVIFANEAAQKILKLQNVEVGSQVDAKWGMMIDNVFAAGVVKKDIEVKSGDKTFSWVMVPILDQGYINIYGMDITARKSKEGK